MAGAGGDYAARLQVDAELAQFVGEPGERDAGIAEHVLAVADEVFAAHGDDGPVLDQIHRAPIGRRRRSQHKEMGAAIVGDQLRFAGADEIGKTRIRNLDRGMQRVDGIQHLLHAVRRRARRQIHAHAEGELRLGDAHFVAGHRRRAAVRNHGLGQNPSGHGAGDIDVLLPGLAGGGDLPAEQMSGGVALDRGLDRVAVGPVQRALCLFERGELGAGTPVFMQRLRRCGNLISFHEMSPKCASSNHDPRLRTHPSQ